MFQNAKRRIFKPSDCVLTYPFYQPNIVQITDPNIMFELVIFVSCK